jgi:hypothetical protein
MENDRKQNSDDATKQMKRMGGRSEMCTTQQIADVGELESENANVEEREREE